MSQSAYEQQGQQLQAARAQVAAEQAPAYLYDWKMLPIGQQLWPEWFETLTAFPPMQVPESYNLSQVMDQIKAAGHASD